MTLLIVPSFEVLLLVTQIQRVDLLFMEEVCRFVGEVVLWNLVTKNP